MGEQWKKWNGFPDSILMFLAGWGCDENDDYVDDDSDDTDDDKKMWLISVTDFVDSVDVHRS